MMTKIRPLHDRVVVKRLDAENKSAGGIVIPDTAGEKPDQGEVVAVGKGKILEDGQVRTREVTQRIQFRSEQCLLKTCVSTSPRDTSCSPGSISSPTRSR